MCWLARTGGLGVALAALALPGAWAQTQTWAVWSSTFTAGTASGTIGGISYSVAVNPVGTSVGGGLAITSYNAASTWWSNTTVYGPNSPATSSDVIFTFWNNGQPFAGNKFNVTVTFASPVIDPMLRFINIDGSVLGTYEDTTLVWGNDQIRKSGNVYYDVDAAGSAGAWSGAAGTVGFTGTFSTLRWYGTESPIVDKGDSYLLTFSAVIPTNPPTTAPTTRPTSMPSKQPTTAPTQLPTTQPSQAPTGQPTTTPTGQPTATPTNMPTGKPTTSPTAAPTPIPYIIRRTGARCQEAGVLVPDNIWDTYPGPVRSRRALIPGRPDAEQCWYYCSNLYRGLIPSYFNLRLLSDRNECYCCGDQCTIVEDPEYEIWTIQHPAPVTPPLPPLPDYETQGVGQRCAEPGVRQETFVPPTQEQCYRLCSNKDGVPQPSTYFNLKTSTDPDECYCVGPVCTVIYDPEYSYSRINNPAPEPPCPKLRLASSPPSRKRLTKKAGTPFKFELGVKGTKDTPKDALSAILAGPDAAAEMVLTVPAGVTIVAVKTSPSYVTATRVPDTTVGPNTYIYKVRSSRAKVRGFKLGLILTVDACNPGFVGEIDATFYPLGRSVPSCAIRKKPNTVMIAANPKKCYGKPAGKHGK